MHGHGMFNDPNIYYLDRPKFFGSWQLPEQIIDQLRKHKLVIVDLSSEHWGGTFENTYKNFDEWGINFLLLSHEPSDHKKFDRMLYYPHWYHWSVDNFNVSRYFTDIKKYHWSCLNLTPRFHRIQNYMLSRAKSYYAQAKFSMHNLPDFDTDPTRVDDYKLDEHILHEWNTVRTMLPTRIQRHSGNPAQSLITPELIDSYIHLITETTVLPRVFLTEKTWKPIAMQQIFLLFGNPGSVEALRRLGVDVFDDIVDHKYDGETDWLRRLDMIHQSLESLLNQDLQAIYQQTKTRRQQNHLKFKNKEFGVQYQRDLSDAIARYC